MIDETRVQLLNDLELNRRGKYVLYWMQASQRAKFNHALEFAIARANEMGLSLIVCFGLMDDYPEANERHYAFMIEGLREVEADLRGRRIKLVVKRGSPAKVALHYAKRASIVVCDSGYTRHQKRWREEVGAGARCSVIQVESDVVIPVETVSDHQEFAARTIRPKIHKLLARYLAPLAASRIKHASLASSVTGDLDLSTAIDQLKLDRTVARSSHFVGGRRAALARLDEFIRTKLQGYADGRNEPVAAQTSTMSPYLHFGNISPIEIALRVRDSGKGSAEDRASYLEELIVRRELGVNFVYYSAKYDSFDALPRWAKQTLRQHARDRRPVTYSLAQLESSATHDPYWNAAQTQMTRTGFMHNYMRMYWGKKIIEWTRSPRKAFEIALHLNNRYFIDGRDPVSYQNVAWLFGLHDRPWGPARKIFGTVRYMNEAGLRRKFDMDAYVRSVQALQSSEE
ncbi:MAG: deoxyribodipyrimidine photo-lyase [Anaerolineae bacterium]|nr:deoxyribodipyrimidine photo-lyase [Phycisphaerae bacterium]